MTDTTLEKKRLLDFAADRYASLKLIDWFNLDRVRKAKVLVIGAGAIGNEVLKNLALLGVGNVFIYDRDAVEMSNLTRSILFRAGDRGRSKAETAARAVADINPDVRVRWQNGDVRFDLGLGLIRRMDVVIGCLDNTAARLDINGKCYKVGLPWVDAGIGQLNGQVSVFKPPHGTCYECAFGEEDYEEVRMPCNVLASMYASEGKIPTTPTIASIVAGVQVQEALKLLAYDAWHGRTLAGHEFSYNGTVENVSIASLPRRPDCPAHDTLDPNQIIELPGASAAHTTFGQLLEEIQERIGAGATLLLNFDLALDVTCGVCGSKKMLLRPTAKLFREELICERCGNERELDPVNGLTARINQSHAGYEFLRDLTIASANVAPLDILAAVAADGRKVYFELTGDELSLLGPFDD